MNCKLVNCNNLFSSIKAVIIIFLFLSLSSQSVAAPWTWEGVDRVIAVGGAHGRLDEFQQLLREISIIDDNGDWSGGNAHLVSLGNLIERGANTRKLLDFIMLLQSQASSAGGRVHLVLGDQELGVLTGTDQIFSNGRYGKWLVELPLMLRINSTLFVHGGLSDELLEFDWNKLNSSHQQSLERYFELEEKLKEDGILPEHVGRATHKEFLQSYLDQETRKTVQTRSAKDARELLTIESEAITFSGDSPVHYAQTVACHPFNESFTTERVLKHFGAERVVVGQSSRTEHRIDSRMGGLVLVNGSGVRNGVTSKGLAAIIMEDGHVSVHHIGRDGFEPIEKESRQITGVSGGLNDMQLEEFLRSADIVDQKLIGTGITNPKKLTLRKDGITLSASYKYFDSHPRLTKSRSYSVRRYDESDRYQYEVAAYRLDRFLDMQMVPVTVLRTIDGKEGAVQYWMPDTINERDRRKQELDLTSNCDNRTQFRLRFIFDILVFNEDRNLTNMLYSRDDYMLRLIDHTRAFRSRVKRPGMYRRVKIELSELFENRLRLITSDNLSDLLGDVLHTRQIAAIVARRDLILREAVRYE